MVLVFRGQLQGKVKWEKRLQPSGPKIGEERWESHRNAMSQEVGEGCRRRYPSGGFLMHPSRQDGSLIPQASIATNREVCGGEQAKLAELSGTSDKLPKDFLPHRVKKEK